MGDELSDSIDAIIRGLGEVEKTPRNTSCFYAYRAHFLKGRYTVQSDSTTKTMSLAITFA